MDQKLYEKKLAWFKQNEKPEVVLLLAVGGWLVRRDGAVPVLSWRLIRFAAARRVWSVSGSFFLMSLPFLLCVQFGPTLAAMTKPSEDNELLTDQPMELTWNWADENGLLLRYGTVVLNGEDITGRCVLTPTGGRFVEEA